MTRWRRLGECGSDARISPSAMPLAVRVRSVRAGRHARGMRERPQPARWAGGGLEGTTRAAAGTKATAGRVVTRLVGVRERERVWKGQSGGSQEPAPYSGPLAPEGRATVLQGAEVPGGRSSRITRVTLRPGSLAFQNWTPRNTGYRTAAAVTEGQGRGVGSKGASASGGAGGPDQSGEAEEGRHGGRPD